MAKAKAAREIFPRLGEGMKQVVKRADEIIKSTVAGDVHHNACATLANEFDLWEDDAFPVWLCRVVEGVMRDGEAS